MSEIGLPKRLVLIRHGQSVRNKVKGGEVFFKDKETLKLVQGTPDFLTKLTKEGERQAAKTGHALKKRFGAPNVVRHSGYERTESTAKGILSAYSEEERAKIEVKFEHRLRERDSGYAYDMTEKQVRKRFPYLKEYWNAPGKFFLRPPGGLSLGDVVEQVEPLTEKLFFGEAGRTEFWVSHGNTIRCIRFLIEGLGYGVMDTMRWPANCGIVAYEFNDGKPTLIAENEQLFPTPRKRKPRT